jgi:membrane associated rhomboid family serine protease
VPVAVAARFGYPILRMSRHPAPPWMRPITERLSPTIRTLVIIQAVLFGLFVMAPPLQEGMRAHLVLGPSVLSGELWQLVTSLFVSIDLWSFFFSMLGLWFAGASVERVLGRRRFLLLFFAAGIAANAVAAAFMALLGMPVMNPGSGESVLAIFVALGVIYGKAPLRVFGQLALQARYLAWIFVGMAILSSLLQGLWPLLAAVVFSQTLAYFLSGGKVITIIALLWRLRRPRSPLQVLEGGRAGGRAKGGKKYVN